jgi:hypothetical protein
MSNDTRIAVDVAKAVFETALSSIGFPARGFRHGPEPLGTPRKRPEIRLQSALFALSLERQGCRAWCHVASVRINALRPPSAVRFAQP